MKAKRYLHVGSLPLVLEHPHLNVQPGDTFTYAFSEAQEQHLLQAHVIALAESPKKEK